MFKSTLQKHVKSLPRCSGTYARSISSSLYVKEGESSTSTKSDRDFEGDLITPESSGRPAKQSQADLSAAFGASLDRIFGNSNTSHSDEYYDDRAGQQSNGWSGQSLKEFRSPSARSQSTVAPSRFSRNKSNRTLKGVHDRRHRGSITPAETENFNMILAGIFADLERTNGPFKPGSYPTSDPYGAQLQAGGGVYRGAGSGGGRRIYRETLDEMELSIDVLAELDHLKEELSTLPTDIDVLEWAQQKIFQPKLGANGVLFYPATYPHILSHTMRTLRLNFNNPHLALAFFQHAQTVDVESYLSGCLTGAYNELLQIRWNSFKDLAGVEQAVREMDLNGVKWDKTTNQLVKAVTLEVSSLLEDGRDIEQMFGMGAIGRFRQLDVRLNEDYKRETIISREKRMALAGRRFVPQSGEERKDLYGEDGDAGEEAGLFPHGRVTPFALR